MHETLNFIAALHDHIEHSVSNPGPWCWPTRELVAHNLKLNRQHYPADRTWRSLKGSINKNFDIAKSRHWMTDEGCSAHCHARHLALTAAGREALRLMNEQGCGPACLRAKVHQHVKLKLERKVAA